jgi:hypothetical protein
MKNLLKKFLEKKKTLTAAAYVLSGSSWIAGEVAF